MAVGDRPAMHTARVTVNKEVADGVWRMVLLAPALASALLPGQFVNVAVPGDPSHLTRVPLSPAHADGAAGTVELLYAVVGGATMRLASVPSATFLSVLGPCGRGWELPGVPGRCLFVSGGMGAPPIFAACRMLVGAGHDCDVILAARTASRLWGVELLEEWGVQYVLVTDDGTAGVAGVASDVMPSLLSAHQYVAAYACGPQPMLARVAHDTNEALLPCQVSLERMMTCGFGACSTCNVALSAGGYALCCSDGPVFDAKEVAW